MTPTHALIDIGNVLLSFEFESALRTLVPAGAANPGERISSLLEKKDELESGRIPEEEFITWASRRLGFTGPADEFRRVWNSIFTPIDPMWASIRELKEKGLTLILFSNTNSIHAGSFVSEYEIFSLFDHQVFSHLVGAIKPHSGIYEYAIETHRLDPSRTLYLDDLPDNIATGEKFGFLTHQYDWHNHEAYLRWLETL